MTADRARAALERILAVELFLFAAGISVVQFRAPRRVNVSVTLNSFCDPELEGNLRRLSRSSQHSLSGLR